VNSLPESIKKLGMLESETYTLWATVLACIFIKPYISNELIKKAYELSESSLLQGNIILKDLVPSSNKAPIPEETGPLISLLSDSGYWPLSEQISKAIGKTVNEIYTTIPETLKPHQESDQMNIWTTILVLDYIKSHYPDQQGVWKACINKGNEYLSFMGVEIKGAFYSNETSTVMKLQKESGYWIFSEDLCAVLQKDVPTLYGKMPAVIKDSNLEESEQLNAWAAWLAIYYLKASKEVGKEIASSIANGMKYLQEVNLAIIIEHEVASALAK
jgi:hypothetical protein